MKDQIKMLSPCSHCGSVMMRELHTVHKKNGSVMYYGRCACGCKTHPYMSPARAIDAWNAKYDKKNVKCINDAARRDEAK